MIGDFELEIYKYVNKFFVCNFAVEIKCTLK